MIWVPKAHCLARLLFEGYLKNNIYFLYSMLLSHTDIGDWVLMRQYGERCWRCNWEFSQSFPKTSPSSWIDGWEGTDWLPPGKPLASLWVWCDAFHDDHGPHRIKRPHMVRSLCLRPERQKIPNSIFLFQSWFAESLAIDGCIRAVIRCYGGNLRLPGTRHVLQHFPPLNFP